MRTRRRRSFRAGWVARQEDRLAYMRSPKWWERRRRWQADEEARTGEPVVCAVTGKPWDADRDDMHHITYTRIGREAHEDLVPLNRAAHERLHRVIDATPALRRMMRTNPHTTTALLLDKLRKEHHDNSTR